MIKSVRARGVPIVVFVLALSLLAASCAPKPSATVTGFYEALKKGDFTKLAGYLQEPGDLTDTDFDNEDSVDMLRKLFGRITYTVAPDAVIEGQTATVNATVTGPDLARILAAVMAEAFPRMLAAAFAGEQQQQEAQAYFENLLNTSITAADAPTATATMALKLVKADGKWLIARGENPLRFLTSGLEQLGDVFGD